MATGTQEGRPCTDNYTYSFITLAASINKKLIFLIDIDIYQLKSYDRLALRGYSSAGRALAWHARGRRFDPA